MSGQCVLCSKPTGDGAYLCSGPQCGRRLLEDLQTAQHLSALLEDTFTRQTRTGSGGGGGGRPSERPLPWAENAAKAGRQLDATVHRWATWLCQVQDRTHRVRIVPQTAGPPCRRAIHVPAVLDRALTGAGRRARTRIGVAGRAAGCDHESCHELRTGATLDLTGQAALLLAREVRWIRHRAEAPVIASQVGTVVARAIATVDRRPDTVYAGKCNEPAPTADDSKARCPGPLYAEPGAAFVSCPVCNAEWDVAKRQVWLRAAARDTLAPAAVIAQALTTFGREVKVARIRKWKERGRLVQRGVDTDGQTPTYRVGDVEDLLAAEETKAQASALHPRRAG